MRKSVLAIVVGVLVLAVIGVFGYNYYKEKTRLPEYKAIPDFTLEKLDGSPFKLSDTDGKVRLVSFIFTNCLDVCPPTTLNMSKIQKELKDKGLFGKDVEMLTISFDPERDTPEVLRKYADSFGADQTGWHFIRGDEKKVAEVAQTFGVGVLKQPDGTFVHTMKIFLIDKDKKMRAIYGMAAEMDMKKIVNDMERLADE
ncbi:MAG: SCO family protein [Clostridia bacterium]